MIIRSDNEFNPMGTTPQSAREKALRLRNEVLAEAGKLIGLDDEGSADYRESLNVSESADSSEIVDLEKGIGKVHLRETPASVYYGDESLQGVINARLYYDNKSRDVHLFHIIMPEPFREVFFERIQTHGGRVMDLYSEMNRRGDSLEVIRVIIDAHEEELIEYSEYSI